jgi:hypothetical protein
MKKNVSRRMFIFVMIMAVIVVLVTTRRESYNPWLPWNWFRKPEPPRPRPMPEPPRPMPKPPRPMPEPPRPRPMPESPGPEALIPEYRMGPPERPYPMPERPRSMDPRLALIPEHNMRPSVPHGLFSSGRPAQPISPGVRARMESR